MSEQERQDPVQPDEQVSPESLPIDETPAERLAAGAYEHTTEAASAFRRGEIIQQTEIDPLADSDDRLIALLSYVTQIFIPVIMPIIVLVSESSKKRPFQRYHAVQSLALVLLFWAAFLLVSIGTGIVQIVPLLGQLIGFIILCLTPIAWFAAVILVLYYGFQAYKGRRFAIPGLTSFLRDQGWL